jgi:ABC-type transport system substrate-binding protein
MAALLLAFFPAALGTTAGPVVASAATAQTCTPNTSNTFTYVANPGAPENYNFLTLSNNGEGTLLRLMYLGSAPTPVDINSQAASGKNDTYDLLTDLVTTNSNYTQWTFYIKPGIDWSNGQPITAQDFIRTFSPSFALNASVDALGLRTFITSVTQGANSSIAVFNLNQSVAYFPTLMNNEFFTSVYPQSFTSAGSTNAGIGASAATLVTSGPFYLSNYVAGSSSGDFLRNPYFYTSGVSEPQICDFHVDFVESSSSDATLLASGSADFAQLDPSNIASVQSSNPNIHIIQYNGTQEQAILWNISAAPYSSLQFRQAMAAIVNYSAIISGAFGGYAISGAHAEGLVSPAVPYYDSNQPTYTTNLALAESLINQTGLMHYIPSSPPKVEWDNGTQVQILLFARNDFTENVVAAQILQQELQSFGFSVSPTVQSESDNVGDSFSCRFNICHAMILDEGPAPLWGSPFADATYPGNIWFAEAPYAQFEGPATSAAEMNYMGNYTGNRNGNYIADFTGTGGILGTLNPQQSQTYLNNIQNINAANLPFLMVTYPDTVMGYNTAHWTNWYTQGMMVDNLYLNISAIAQLAPVGATSSTTATGSHTSTSATGTPTGTATSTSSTSTGSTTTSSNNTTLYIVAAVVIIILVVGVVAVMMRRGRGGGAPATT